MDCNITRAFTWGRDWGHALPKERRRPRRLARRRPAPAFCGGEDAAGPAGGTPALHLPVLVAAGVEHHDDIFLTYRSARAQLGQREPRRSSLRSRVDSFGAAELRGSVLDA